MENVGELKPSEIFIVNIRHIRNMHGYDYLQRTIAKAFSSEENAKEALVDMGFVYGKPYPFRVAGWYHKSIQISICMIYSIILKQISSAQKLTRSLRMRNGIFLSHLRVVIVFDR